MRLSGLPALGYESFGALGHKVREFKALWWREGARLLAFWHKVREKVILGPRARDHSAYVQHARVFMSYIET